MAKMVKLNRTMSGHRLFTHRLELSYSEYEAFAKIIAWCTQTWGESLPLDVYEKCVNRQNPHWAWERNDSKNSSVSRFYFKTADEMSVATLVWG